MCDANSNESNIFILNYTYVYFYSQTEREIKPFNESLILSLHQDVTYGFDVFVSIICLVLCRVSTRALVMRFPSRSKPDSGITTFAVILLIT